MNGAAEAILEDLLKSSIAQQAILQKLAGSFSPTSSSSATAGLTAVGIAAKAAGIALSTIKGAFDLLSSVVSGLGSIIGQTIGHFVNLGSNLFDFAKKAAYGTAQLSEFINVFKDLPLVGKAFELFAGVIKYQEELLGVYRKLSNSGATFGGSLQAMNHAANQAYLSLEEFQNVVQKNSDLFAGLGGANVDRGIVAFVDANKKLIGPDSPYAQSILGLGVTAEQASGFLATTMRSQGLKNKQETASADQLAKYTNEYVKTLDDMSRLTGMRRDQLDEEVKKAEQDSLWATFTDGLDSASAAAAQNMLAMAAPFGKAAEDEVKARLRGLDAPVSAAGENLAIMSRGASLAGDGVRKAMTGTADEQRKAMSEYLGNVSRSTNEMVKQVGTQGQAAGVLGDMVNGQALRTGRIMEKGGMTFDQAMQKASMDQAKAAKGPAGVLAKAEQDIKIFGSHVNDIFMKLISPITGPLTALSGGLIKTIDGFISSDGFNAAIKEVTKIMDDVISWLSGAFNNISKAFGKDHNWKAAIEETFSQAAKGFNNVWKFLEPGFTLLWEQAKPSLISAFNGIVDFISPYLKKALDVVIDSVSDWIYEKTGIGEGSAQRQQRQMLEQTKYYQDWMEDQKKKLGGHGLQTLGFTGWSDMDKKSIFEKFQSDRSVNSTDAIRASGGQRHSGTIGMTGNWWEKEDTTVNIQKGETVVTPSQLDQIVGSASQSGLAQSIQQLNSLTTQMLAQMKQTAEYTRRNYDATRALGGNLFEAA